MRTWDGLTAGFVRGLKKPGKFYDRGGLMLSAARTKTRGVVTKAWLFRYQFDKRERVMGLGSARVVSLVEARAKANKARKALAAGVDPLADRDETMHGLLIKTTDGNARRNPLVKIAADAAEDIVRFAGEFGLTPIARQRLGAAGYGPQAPPSKFDGLLGGDACPCGAATDDLVGANLRFLLRQ